MNKIKQLFEENYAHVPLDDLDSAYIQTFASTIYNMMYKFGEECFNKGREEVHNLDFNDPNFGPSLKYKNFENYLNSLE